MALVLQDRVRETSSTAGTGDISLGGAYVGYRTFSSCVPNGSVVYYCIQNTTAGYESEWEVGYGTYTTSGNTLSRDTVYSSSAGGTTKVAFSSPAALSVFITQPAEQAVYQQTNGDLLLINGVIGVSEDGTTGTTLPNTSFQAFATGDYYMQANQQNLDSGASASADWVVTADNGSDTTNFIDMGMASSGYNYPDFGAQDPNSGYVISTGANLQLVAGKYGANVAGANASTTDIVFVAGDLLKSGVRGFIKGSTGNWILGPNGTSDTGEKLQVTGTSKFTGNASFGSFVYSAANTAAGNSTTLATKAYVDTYASGINIHASCVYATTVDLGSVTYNNGTDGVGATLTNAGTQAALQIDGHTFTGTDVSNAVRVLVKNESNAAYNGIYTVTNQGSGSTNWVLTRATDYDTGGTGAGAISVGDYTFITSGSTNAYTSWVQTTTGTITIGTTNIVFVEFSQATQYTGTAPINVSGQTIALTGVVDVAHGGTNLSSFTSGDLLYASGATTLSKRAIGSTGNVLIVSGGLPSWGTVDLSSSNAVTSTLTQDHGGTGFNTYTLGDLIYSNATNTLAKLPGQTTTTKKYLSQTGDGVNSAAPAWAQVAAADISGLAPSATTDTSNATNITSGTLPTGRLTGSYTGVTGVGTLTAGTWNANTVAVSYGGTGVATLTGLAYGNGTSAFTAATGSQVVAVIGSTAVANATYAVSSNSSTYSSNIIGGLAGGIPYQTGANATTILAAGTGVLVGGSTPTYSTTPTLTGTNFSGIPNGATTASASNGASTIVARDINGSFAANVVTANLSGTATSATTAVNVAAANLTGTTLSSNVTASTLTSVGTLTSLTVSGGANFATSSGSVGIGTSSPLAKLNVSGGGVVVSSDGDYFSGGAYYNAGWKNSVSSQGGWAIRNSTGVFTVYTGSSPGTAGSAFTDFLERMRIDSSGNVGIGTSSPQGKLEVYKDNATGEGATLVLTNTGAGVGTSVGLYMAPNAGGGHDVQRAASIRSVQPTSGNYADLRFYTANSDVPAERMRIDTVGNVGIAVTPSGTYKLEVSGAVGATSYAGSGAALTTLNAANLSSGTVATARLGSGTANSTTYLRGDSTWATLSSGITINDDTATATSIYPMCATVTSGSASSANITSTKLTFVPSTGTLSATVHVSSSDERLKKDWADVDADFVPKLAAVKHGTFTRIDNEQRDVGVSAQSLEQLLKEAVVETPDGMKSVNYGGAALVAAIELAKEVVKLREEIEALKYPKTGA